MVNGRLRCLGSGQHLKLRFGNGYEVDLKTKIPQMSDMLPFCTQLQKAGLIQMTQRFDVSVDESQSSFSASSAAAAEDGEGEFNKLTLKGPLNAVCDALMEPERISLIAPNSEGAGIYDLLQIDGTVPLRIFLEWWIAQNYADKLSIFIEKEFPGAILLERSTSHSFRFRLPTAEVPLAVVFGKFEGAKNRLNCIEDYSVGQTTLEQIFNQFAASQDNPEVEQAQLRAEADRAQAVQNPLASSKNIETMLKRTSTNTGYH